MLFGLVTVDAAAYSTNSIVSEPCHERLTRDSLVKARKGGGDLPRLEPTTQDDHALLQDLPVDPSLVDGDLALATLILHNREVDLAGNQPGDLDHLANVHGAAKNQKHHCLRAPKQDVPEGSAQALDDCRQTIRELAERALTGLDDGDGVLRRTTKNIFLPLRGRVDIALPQLYVYAGRALHTLQDGFSHTIRQADDPTQVLGVLNYVDVVRSDYEPAVDGPRHISPMDDCMDLDSFRTERYDAAVDAGSDFLVALSQGDTRAVRLEAVDEVLDRYLTISGECGPDGDWCGAQELGYAEDSGCLCSLHAASGSRFQVAGLGLLLLGALLIRRRRPSGVWMLSGTLLCVSMLLSTEATAETADPTADATADAAEGDCVTCAEQPTRFPLGLYGYVGGSADEAALVAGGALRYRLGQHWLIGAGAEYNPFISRPLGDIHAGVVNVFGSLIGRVPMRYEPINLRTTLHVGISRMNFDLVGVPKGSLGPFFALTPIGLDYEMSRSVYLVFDPVTIVVPVPKTEGVPYAYPQYRATLGLQWGG